MRNVVFDKTLDLLLMVATPGIGILFKLAKFIKSCLDSFEEFQLYA